MLFTTVKICIFLANGLFTFTTFLTVALASLGVANFIFTVSLGFSSVYNLLPEPFGFLPVPLTGQYLAFFLAIPNFFISYSNFSNAWSSSFSNFILSKSNFSSIWFSLFH